MSSAPEIKARLIEDRAVSGTRRRIVVALSEQPPHGSGQPLVRVTDLTLLLFDKRSGWQRRVHLIQADGEAGRYAAEVNVPQGMAYDMFVGSISQDLPFVRGRLADARGAQP